MGAVEQTALNPDVRRLLASLGEFPEPVAAPFLVVVSGLPGTGKSYFCRQLARRLAAAILESDALRKALFPKPDYRAAESTLLFRAIHRLIADLLAHGVPLIFDATNLAERRREYLYQIAERALARLVIVRTEAPPRLVYERLKARRDGEENNSDADWAVYQKMKPQVEQIRRHHYAVDTSRDTTPVLDKIVRELKR